MTKIEGLEELQKQLNKLKKTPTKKALLAGAYTLQRFSMINAPYKTGFLKSSHSSRETQEGAVMEVAVNYAFFQEFGCKNSPGHPFVRPAIDEHSTDIVEAVAKEVEEEIKKVE